MSTRFVRLELEAGSREAAERAIAEAFDAGASGLEEREGEAGPGTRLLLYAPREQAAGLREALRGLGAAVLRIGPTEPEPERDWSIAWQAGLRPTRISKRLAVRPETVPLAAEPGQALLVISPGQAFGTGGHASTRLALVWIDALSVEPAAPLRGARLLDVGCGSGVLALAGLALGAREVLACDLDPLAVHATRENAARNALGAAPGARLAVFRGSTTGLAPDARFDVVVANLLRRESEPLLGDLAACLAPGGCAVFSGLLVADRAPFTAALEACGLVVVAERREHDGGDDWIGLLTTRPADRASLRGAGEA